MASAITTSHMLMKHQQCNTCTKLQQTINRAHTQKARDLMLVYSYQNRTCNIRLRTDTAQANMRTQANKQNNTSQNCHGCTASDGVDCATS